MGGKEVWVDRGPGGAGWSARSPSSASRAIGPRVRRWLVRAARWSAVGAAAIVLPFFVLLRGATWLYGAGLLGTWTALAAGALLTFLILAAYVLVAARWVRRRIAAGGARWPARSVAPGGSASGKAGRRATSRWMLQGVAVVVAAYCGYGLVFLSGANARSQDVRAEYRSLHPHLRVAVATLVLADSDLLVTDAARALEDYAAMGLPPNAASLHLEQRDGYAHALDLRTAGRPGWLNLLVRAWFAGTGFHTLRHVGTADHLHVSLPPPGGD